MLYRQEYQLELLNGYLVTKNANEHGLKKIMQLEQIASGDDHLCLVYSQYEMTLSEYRSTHYDPRALPMIFAQVIQGVEELHSLGFIRRALTPDHIVLNRDPLDVRLISFTLSFPNSQSTHGAITRVMIMECDLPIGSLLGVSKYEDLCLRAQEYVSKEGVLSHLSQTPLC